MKSSVESDWKAKKALSGYVCAPLSISPSLHLLFLLSFFLLSSLSLFIHPLSFLLPSIFNLASLHLCSPLSCHCQPALWASRTPSASPSGQLFVRLHPLTCSTSSCRPCRLPFFSPPRPVTRSWLLARVVSESIVLSPVLVSRSFSLVAFHRHATSDLGCRGS